MSDQLNLLDHARELRAREAPASLEERFDAFDRDNPHVYRTLVRLAREAQAAGMKRIGMKALFERLRWEMRIATRGDEFKLNNNLTALYSRKLIANEPDLADMFETRKRRSA